MTDIFHSSAGEFYLYIVVREPIFLGHPGKIAAQCAHAGTQHAEHFRDLIEQAPDEPANSAQLVANEIMHSYNEWKNSGADRFGTTIVLGAPTSEAFFEAWQEMCYTPNSSDSIVSWGKIHDPSFPASVGDTIVLAPLDTCFWAFLPKRGNPYPFGGFKWQSQFKLLS